MSTELSPDSKIAAEFVGTLWTAIRSVGGPYPDTDDHHLFRGLFDPAWLGGLALPIGSDRPATQTVALGQAMEFDRPEGPEELAAAYAKDPRVQIYESVDARSGGWPAAATRLLMKLGGCGVTCTVYESRAGEKNLGPHRDDWYGAIVQKLGAKAWLLGEGADNPTAEPTLVLEAGDVLLLPRGVLHHVRTPDYSVHMGIAFITDRRSAV